MSPSRHDHDPNGRYAAKFSDRDYFRHDDIDVVFEMAEVFYDARDYLSGDGNVAVTIGPAEAIDFPEVEQPELQTEGKPNG